MDGHDLTGILFVFGPRVGRFSFQIDRRPPVRRADHYFTSTDADATSASSDIVACDATPRTSRRRPDAKNQLSCKLSPAAMLIGPGALMQLIAGPTLTH